MSAFQIAGYDRRTDLIAIHHDLPNERVAEIRALARIEPEDDGYGSYRLDSASARTISNWFSMPFPVDAYDWFVEPSN